MDGCGGWNVVSSDGAGCPETKGPVKNRFAFLGVEAPAWQGVRREHTGSIRPTSNAAKRDASAARNVKLFLTGP